MKVLCVGGGTLGSVTPLLAVVEELRKRCDDLEVEWWGTDKGPEKNLVVLSEIPFRVIAAGKFRRYLSAENFKDLFNVAVGFVQSLWRLGLLRFDCVLTAGSYVAVPVGWAAYLSGIPVFVHQQDVQIGLANKLLTVVAEKITVTLAECKKDFPVNKSEVTGNPVRQVFLNSPNKLEAKKKLSLDHNKPAIVVIGGGTGAWALNKIVFEARNDLVKIGQVVNITGFNKQRQTDLSLSDFITMPLAQESITVLAAADLVITRAGMGVLSELSALKKAAIVVPMPDSHQVDNAKYFADKDAVVYIKQTELTPEKLLATVSRLINNESERIGLGERLQEVLPVWAAPKIAQMIIDSVNHKEPCQY